MTSSNVLLRNDVHVHGDGPPSGAEAGASQGVGLGLYIVREIARAHAGRVEAHSTAAEGTNFVLELPCA